MKLEDKDKPWASHVVCNTSVERLRQWTRRTRQSMGFGIPTVSREPTYHVNNCYYCSINMTGVNKRSANL